MNDSILFIVPAILISVMVVIVRGRIIAGKNIIIPEHFNHEGFIVPLYGAQFGTLLVVTKNDFTAKLKFFNDHFEITVLSKKSFKYSELDIWIKEIDSITKMPFGTEGVWGPYIFVIRFNGFEDYFQIEE